jgi:hypothetical protein
MQGFRGQLWEFQQAQEFGDRNFDNFNGVFYFLKVVMLNWL